MALVGMILVAPLMMVIAILVKLTSRGPVFYTQDRVGVDRRGVSPEKLWRAPSSGNGHGAVSSNGHGSDAGIGRGAFASNGYHSATNGGGSRAMANGDRRFGTDGRGTALNVDDGAHSGNGHAASSGSGFAVSEIRDDRSRDGGGRTFTIYKFRTMYVDAGDEQVWARPDDDRVTPVGRVLRALHLDELPQLFNVLIGDMNVVGPRPEQPEIFEQLARKIPGYGIRQQVLPGITGWAQVNHHYDQSLEDVRIKVEYDLEYLQRRSPTEDLKIIFRTVPAVLLGEDGRGW